MSAEPFTQAVVTRLPKCDLCGAKAEYDAVTKDGPWAFMCEPCFKRETEQKLGLGVGQKLVLPEEVAKEATR